MVSRILGVPRIPARLVGPRALVPAEPVDPWALGLGPWVRVPAQGLGWPGAQIRKNIKSETGFRLEIKSMGLPVGADRSVL